MGWIYRHRFVLLIFVVAVGMRLAAIGRYITPDEIAWVYRSVKMRQALLAHDWAHTIQTGHPGVTTTWIGALGVQLVVWLKPSLGSDLAWAEKLAWLTPSEGEPFQRLAIFLTAARLGVVAVTSGACLLLYRLLRSRYGERSAVFAALWVALDPFTAGLSGLLHTDALLATFIVIAFLFALDSRHPRSSAVFAGLATGLAVLSKLPGVLLIGFLPLYFVAESWPERAWKRGIGRIILWSLSLIAIVMVLLPSIWADPSHLLNVITKSSTTEINLVASTNFLGRSNNQPPGGLFYLIVLLWRLSPVVMIGLGVGAWQFGRTKRLPVELIGLGLFALLFVGGLSVSDRVFDRYLLPVTLLMTMTSGVIFGRYVTQRHAFYALLAVQLLYAGVNWAFPLYGYNWLMGGLPTARWALPVGWGETSSVVARQIAPQIDPSGIVYTNNVPGVAPFVSAETRYFSAQTRGDIRPQDVVLLAGQAETPLLQGIPPQQLVVVQGEKSAWWTQLPPAPDWVVPLQPIEAQFNAQLALDQVGMKQEPNSGHLLIKTVWHGLQSADFTLQFTVEDDARYVWLKHVAKPLTNRQGLPVTGWPLNDPQSADFRVRLPSDLPPGQYHLIATVTDSAENRLTAYRSNRFAGIQLDLGRWQYTPPPTQSKFDIPHPLTTQSPIVGTGQAGLLAFGTGETATFDLWWRADSRSAVALVGQIGTISVTIPLDSAEFRPDQTYHLRPAFVVPLESPIGRFPFLLQAIDAHGDPLWPEPVLLGEVELLKRDRSFTLPPDLQPLDVQFVPLAVLQSVKVEREGSLLRVRLIWQSAETTPISYYSFIHLRSEAGDIVAQQDRPLTPPTNQWVTGQIISETIEFDAPPPFHAIAIGLYDPSTGVRSPVFDAQRNPVSAEQWLVIP